MSPKAPSTRPRQWLTLRYWWPPLALLAVVVAVIAWLHPYKPVTLADIPEPVRGEAERMDKLTGPPIRNSFQYSTRRNFTARGESEAVDIRVNLQPLGHGLLLRQDEWYGQNGHSVVFQERYVLFRNLFSVHTRTREVAPIMHDLMGRIGWFNDSASGLRGTIGPGTPDDPAWKLDVVLDRVSDTDGNDLTLKTTRYQRTISCVRSGTVEAATLGEGFTGTYPKVSCRQKNSDQASERTSEYAWLARQGIFMLTNYQQQGSDSDTLAVKGTYTSFKAIEPAP